LDLTRAAPHGKKVLLGRVHICSCQRVADLTGCCATTRAALGGSPEGALKRDYQLVDLLISPQGLHGKLARVLIDGAGSSKVCYLCSAILCHDDIPRFQVQVRKSSCMHHKEPFQRPVHDLHDV
jgi:hypothetical protein